MDGFEINKILGAVLGTALLIVALRNFGDSLFEPSHLEKNAYPVAVAGAAAGSEAGAATPAALDIPKLLADAKPERGARIADKCLSCHTFAKGGPNQTGPNLWGVVGGPVAHLGDAFPYSSALKKFGGDWTYERLFGFLENPAGYLAGTKMTFAGLSKPTDRADIIAYLRTQTDNPPPLPAVTGAPAAPAGGAAPSEAAPAGTAAPGATPTPSDGGAAPANGPATAPGAAPGSTPPTGGH
jgi:cytochrome c